MRRIYSALLFLSLVLFACVPGGPSPEASPPTLEPTPSAATGLPSSDVIPVSTTEVLPPAKLIATLSTPHIEQGPDGPVTESSSYPGGCGFQWAQQDLPELSSLFQQSVQELQPEAQAYAFAFGENCVLADGTVDRFIPMETDFNITLQVADLADQDVLGGWIVEVMQVIENTPPDLIVGPRPGRVSIIFKSGSGSAGAIFYIDQYRGLPAGISNAEIFQQLQTPQ